jgi:hypothetical protein
MLVGKKADGAKEARDWCHEHWIRAAAGEEVTVHTRAANEKMHYNSHIGFNPTTRFKVNRLCKAVENFFKTEEYQSHLVQQSLWRSQEKKGNASFTQPQPCCT